MLGATGRFLLIAGLVLAVVGLLLILGERYRIPLLGRLPGDIRLERPGFTFYFPWVSFLLLSIALTIILNLIFGLWRR